MTESTFGCVIGGLYAPMIDKRPQPFDETGDPKYVEKAHRRGKIGWKIGDRIEVDPHFRRPHFAIRWCEEGRRVPRLRPIKGCIVHRHKATTVPTGLMG